MAMFDQQNVVGLTITLNRADQSVDGRERSGHFNRRAGPAEAFVRKGRVANVQKLDATACWRLGAVSRHTN
jgi:hypothetical protein